MKRKFASTSGSELVARKLNDSLYELHKPSGTPNMQVIFFHGLPFGDLSETHISTWKTDDGCIWPKTWLTEEFPNAHILVVNYSEGLGEGGVGNFHMHNIGENLTSDLIQGKIGQTPDTPVVLVGHSFGGLVIKKLCVQAHDTLHKSSQSHGVKLRQKLKNFLRNIKGIFYYSTPHHGSPHIEKAKDLQRSPLFKYFTTLSTEAALLNQDFNFLGELYGWQVGGLGELLPVESGVFKGVVVVPEASARDGVTFNVDERANHFSICKPKDKTSRRFYALIQLLGSITDNLNEEIKTREEARVQAASPKNSQPLPAKIKGIASPSEQVKAQLKKSKTLGLVGMGGSGKTTLAKFVFNQLNCTSSFEYTCFVPDTKLITGDMNQVIEEVWRKFMHDRGGKVGEKEQRAQLRGKKLLLVLDDVSDDRDIDVLLHIADETSPESCFMVTSRDRQLLNSLDGVYEVQPLDKDNSHELFMSHAFQNQVLLLPPKLECLVNKIVKKCEGLPLTLEVIGKYVRGKDDVEDWEQTLDALDRAEAVTDLDQRLWAKLRLSYDGLGVTEQQMFLDATTFFGPGNWSLREAKAAWREVYQTTSERLFWQTSVTRSLVYAVKDDETIKVHEQLQSLGRKIALESGNDGRCRVSYVSTEACMQFQTTNEEDNKVSLA